MGITAEEYEATLKKISDFIQSSSLQERNSVIGSALMDGYAKEMKEEGFAETLQSGVLSNVIMMKKGTSHTFRRIFSAGNIGRKKVIQASSALVNVLVPIDVHIGRLKDDFSKDRAGKVLVRCKLYRGRKTTSTLPLPYKDSKGECIVDLPVESLILDDKFYGNAKGRIIADIAKLLDSATPIEEYKVPESTESLTTIIEKEKDEREKIEHWGAFA